jgi:hypothetical protein
MFSAPFVKRGEQTKVFTFCVSLSPLFVHLFVGKAILSKMFFKIASIFIPLLWEKVQLAFAFQQKFLG